MSNVHENTTVTGIDLSWWNALPLEQHLIASTFVVLADAWATGDRKREASVGHILARLSLELADDPRLLPEAFERCWQRGMREMAWSA